MDPSSEARLWSKIDRQGDHWMWQGKPNSGGYGRFWVDGRLDYAHRVVYRHLVGPIHEHVQLDHTCRVHLCVRPEHLDPVTSRVNILRGIGPAATHHQQTQCVNGHPFDEENTYWRLDRANPSRICRRCRRDNLRRFYVRRRESALNA